MKEDFRLGLTIGLASIFTYAVCGGAIGFSAAVIASQAFDNLNAATFDYLMLGIPVLSTAIGSALTYFDKPFKNSALYSKGMKRAATLGAIASIFGASVCMHSELTNDDDIIIGHQASLKQAVQDQSGDRTRVALTV